MLLLRHAFAFEVLREQQGEEFCEPLRTSGRGPLLAGHVCHRHELLAPLGDLVGQHFGPPLDGRRKPKLLKRLDDQLLHLLLVGDAAD